MDPFVFLVGCARSGTTLLQRLLNAHSLLALAPEMHWITHALKRRKWYSRHCLVTSELLARLADHEYFPYLEISRDDFIRLAGSAGPVRCSRFLREFFALYAKTKGKPLVGTKTPAFVRRMATLHTMWPGAKFIHLIRDGRDVCLSVRDWDHAGRSAGRYFSWAVDPVATTALWWKYKVRTGRQGGQALGNDLYQEVRYENLVLHPAEECARLCAFLGVPYEADMLRFHERHPQRVEPGHPWGPITPGLRNWRAQMLPGDVERFEAVAGDLLEELGYPRAFPSPSPGLVNQAARIRELFTQDVRSREEMLPESW